MTTKLDNLLRSDLAWQAEYKDCKERQLCTGDRDCNERQLCMGECKLAYRLFSVKGHYSYQSVSLVCPQFYSYWYTLRIGVLYLSYSIGTKPCILLKQSLLFERENIKTIYRPLLMLKCKFAQQRTIGCVWPFVVLSS